MNHKTQESKEKYSSKGKAPNGEPFLRVKQARGYYEYSERPGYDSIAFILYDNAIKKFALINESKPPMDERFNDSVKMTTAFGGSIDMEKSYKEICKTEVLEESGYDVSLDRIHSIGQTLVSTQMSQLCEGFLVDVTSIKKTHQAEYEMNENEDKNDEFIGNSVRWFNADELMNNNDWKSIWIFTKSVYTDIITKD